MLKKMLLVVLSLAAAMAVLLSSTVANACPPFIAYQPKAPKSLIK